jgi:hypothetical protein
MTEAIRREKQLKKWNPLWKIEPIEKANPGRRDYGRRLFGAGFPFSRVIQRFLNESGLSRSG